VSVGDHVPAIAAVWRELGFNPFANGDIGEDVRRECARLWDERDALARAQRRKPTSRVVENLPSSSTSLVVPSLTTRDVSTAEAVTTAEGVTTREGEAFLRSLPFPLEAVLGRARSSGRSGHLEKQELATWKIRLAVERGIAQPANVDTVALPEGTDGSTVTVWAGFVFLLECKWRYDYGAPTLFSREFAAPWCGVSEWQARDGITTLKRMGYMLPVGKYAVGKYGRRPATLWLPRGARSA
jgi:hypothetical protein